MTDPTITHKIPTKAASTGTSGAVGEPIGPAAFCRCRVAARTFSTSDNCANLF